MLVAVIPALLPTAAVYATAATVAVLEFGRRSLLRTFDDLASIESLPKELARIDGASYQRCLTAGLQRS